MAWAKTTARGCKKHLSFGIWCDLYWMFYGNGVLFIVNLRLFSINESASCYSIIASMYSDLVAIQYDPALSFKWHISN